MFLILVSGFALLVGVLWQYGNLNVRRILNWVLPVYLSFVFISFYFNGEDWINYYFPLHEKSIDPYLMYEPLFVWSFISLQAIVGSGFGCAVLVFYYLAFSSFVAVVKKAQLNPYFFFAFFILTIGNTFILEQIRQLMAAVFVVWAFFWLVEGRLKWALIFMVAAMLSHFAAVVMALVFWLVFLPSKRKFVAATVALGVIFTLLIFNVTKILPYFDWLGFAFAKLSSYVDNAQDGFALGYFSILDFLFIFYFLFLYDEKDKLVMYLMRIAFTGAVFQFVFNFFPVMLRFISFHYVFIAILLAIEFPKMIGKIKIMRIILPVGLGLMFVLFSFSSYYRNPLHPVAFFNLDFSGLRIFFSDHDIYAIAREKFMVIEEGN